MGIFKGAASGGGRIVADTPTLSYAGSGNSNNGIFTILNYNSTNVYTVNGSGYVSGNTLIVSSSTASASLVSRTAKGLSNSVTVTAFRQAPTQGSYYVQTAPYQCHGCSAPQGFAAPCCAPGPCGCGTFHTAGAFPYTGFWACCDQGYYVNYYNSFTSSGYTWGGNDYTNGQGEWWKII